MKSILTALVCFLLCVVINPHGLYADEGGIFKEEVYSIQDDIVDQYLTDEFVSMDVILLDELSIEEVPIGYYELIRLEDYSKLSVLTQEFPQKDIWVINLHKQKFRRFADTISFIEYKDIWSINIHKQKFRLIS